MSSAIVAPRKPPTLKRTRPDRHIGEIGSIHDVPRRSRYGTNGPPTSSGQSFYFHHEDPDFAALLPQVDRSRYEWPDEPVSESSSDGEEVPDSKESLQAMVSTATVAIATQNSASLLPSTVDRRRRSVLRDVQQSRTPRNRGTLEQDCTSDLPVASNTAREGMSVDLNQSAPLTVPAIIITTPNSSSKSQMIGHDVTAVPFPSLRKADVAIKSTVAQDANRVPIPPFPSVSPIVIECTDTQETFNSTQQSEVFSPPDTFEHFTPPSQEGTQQVAMSQVVPASIPKVEAKEAKAKAPRRLFRRSLPSPSQSGSFEPTLGKRSRAGTEGADDQGGLKRRRSLG